MPQLSDICAQPLQGAEEGLQLPASRPVGRPRLDARGPPRPRGLPPAGDFLRTVGTLPRGEPGCCRKPCGPMGHVPTAETQPHSRRTRGGHLDEPTCLALVGLNTGFPHIQEDTGDYKAPLVLVEASLSPTNRPPPQGFLHIQTFTVKGDEPPCRVSGRQMVLLNCVLKRKNRRGASGRSAGDSLHAQTCVPAATALPPSVPVCYLPLRGFSFHCLKEVAFVLRHPKRIE